MMTYPDAFFIFFKILVFWGVRGGSNGQKIAQNEKKKHLSYSVSRELYLIVGFGTHA